MFAGSLLEKEMLQLDQVNAWSNITKRQENGSPGSNIFCLCGGRTEEFISAVAVNFQEAMVCGRGQVGGLIGCRFIIWADLREKENSHPLGNPDTHLHP